MSKQLEKRIQKWRNRLHAHSGFEEGAIAELEDHLRSVIEEGMAEGMSESEAFEAAASQIGNLSDLSIEESRAQTSVNRGLLMSFTRSGARFFRKQKLTSTINLLGMSVAVAATLFIGIFIHDELTYEYHHPESEDVYRLSYQYQQEDGSVEDRAYSAGLWGDILRDQSSAVTDRFRYVTLSYGYLHNPTNNHYFYEEEIYWSDPNFFDFLHFPLKYGEPEQQLKSQNDIILTETTAKLIFGDQNPIGKQLSYHRTSNKVDFIVSGVIYDPPSNSRFQPRYIAHIQAAQGIYGERNRGWIDRNPRPGYLSVYLKIPNPDQVEQVATTLTDYWADVIPERAKRIDPIITPLRSIHFLPAMKWEFDTPIDTKYLYGLGIIGLFILGIALVNFSNLTTAQATYRQKEIGLRKTLGSSNLQLKWQFFMESATLVTISIFLGIGLMLLLIPSFNELVGKNISIHQLIGSEYFLGTTSTALLILIGVSGIIPAFYFTKSKDAGNLTKHFKAKSTDGQARFALVVIQFAIAIILVISTFTVSNQLNLINDGTLAKNRNAVIGIRTSRMGDSLQVQRFKHRINSLNGVANNTLGMHLPRQSDFGRIDTKYYADKNQTNPLFWNKFDADGGFLKTYDLQLLAGRDFISNIEYGSLIINETAALGIADSPEEAIGKLLNEDSINYVFGRSNGQVVGVVADFAYESLKESIEPLVICANTYVEGALSVKLSGETSAKTISELAGIWEEIYPTRPFEYWFLDKEYARLYGQERRLGKLIPIFSSLAIIISLLGLFALTVHVAESRKKEIGIRKVLGCSKSGILKLLSIQFVKTLSTAVIIAIPLSYFSMNQWLDGFTYRVNVEVWSMLAAVLLIAVVAFVTMSIKTLQAATSNPVDSLKYE